MDEPLNSNSREHYRAFDVLSGFRLTAYYYFSLLTICCFLPQGEKNNGFDVLYHNMKHGQISSKELTDFIRERYVVG